MLEGCGPSCPGLFVSLTICRSGDRFDIHVEQQVPVLGPFEHVRSHVGGTRDQCFIWARTQVLLVRAQYSDLFSIPLISMHLLLLLKSIWGANVPKIL